jgi:hypothetical protein
MNSGSRHVDLPRSDVPLTGTARIGVLAVQRPGTPGLGLWIGIESRSGLDVSATAFCTTGRGFPIPLHLAEALAQEIVAVARRASELRLWEPPEPGSAA